MNNFSFCSPTEFVFGADIAEIYRIAGRAEL